MTRPKNAGLKYFVSSGISASPNAAASGAVSGSANSLPISSVAGVRGHDDDGVLEVDVAAFAVLHRSLVEDLVEHVLHAGMRLFHLVEQDDRIGRRRTASVRIPPSP